VSPYERWLTHRAHHPLALVAVQIGGNRFRTFGRDAELVGSGIGTPVPRIGRHRTVDVAMVDFTRILKQNNLVGVLVLTSEQGEI
jgi:hypothetical protein